MGRPTKTRNFHAYMWDILDKLRQNDEQPVLLKFEAGFKAAKNFQLDFLAFRNAAVNEGYDRPKDTFDEILQSPEDIKKTGRKYVRESVHTKAMYPMLNAYKTRIRVIDDVYHVEIYHMDFTEDAYTIRNQLGLEHPVPLTHPDWTPADLGGSDFDKPSAYNRKPPSDSKK